MQVREEIKTVLSDVLALGKRTSDLRPESELLGVIPELDSMAVIDVITAIEAHFGISIADDEISADTFATLGSLTSFVQEKLSA